MKKRILTLVMALALLFSLCTPVALAEDGPTFSYALEITKNGAVFQNVTFEPT